MANPSEEQKFEPRLQQAPVDNNITIEFMFAGINMFWARLRLITKMSLRRAQNIFMPKNLNSIVIFLFFNLAPRAFLRRGEDGEKPWKRRCPKQDLCDVYYA